MTTLNLPVVVSARTKWIQLFLGLVCMASISSPQYVWTLLTRPLAEKMGVGLAELQVTFSLLIILQTFFSPFQGKLIDRFGPRRLIAIGTLLSGLSWVLASQVTNLTGLYLAYGCLGGLGTGIVYVGVVGLMVRWFPQQRGFAAGAVAAGYGMGAILTTFPVANSLAAYGLEHTLWLFGAIFRWSGCWPARAESAAGRGDRAGQPFCGAVVAPVPLRRDAAPAAVLADVCHDGHDVDLRPDGDLANGDICP